MTAHRFSHGSSARLTRHDLDRFPGEGLFDRIARVTCEASCLPRKELYEAWEVARRSRRLFRGGRVVDLGAGHGLLGQVMLLLDDSSREVVLVDRGFPASAARLQEVVVARWPRLRGRVRFVEGGFDAAPLASGDVVVSCHACGSLTDEVLDRAASARARVAVLPCCHNHRTADRSLIGWLDPALAIDVARVERMRAHGYDVRTQTIPDAITPKNRLLLGSPRRA